MAAFRGGGAEMIIRFRELAAMASSAAIVAGGYSSQAEGTTTEQQPLAAAHPDGDEPGCPPRSPDHWEDHPATWPASSLTLGGTTYTQAELLATLQGPVDDDASVVLGRQLLATMLDIGQGTDPAPVTAALIPTPDVVNSCASNPFSGRTVYTSNDTDVVLLRGTSLAIFDHQAGEGDGMAEDYSTGIVIKSLEELRPASFVLYDLSQSSGEVASSSRARTRQEAGLVSPLRSRGLAPWRASASPSPASSLAIGLPP
jgi:hypothetical protein